MVILKTSVTILVPNQTELRSLGEITRVTNGTVNAACATVHTVFLLAVEVRRWKVKSDLPPPPFCGQSKSADAVGLRLSKPKPYSADSSTWMF